MPFKANHKEITLTDSQEKLTVRNLQASDYMFTGRIPDTALGTFIALSGKKDVNIQDIDPDTANFLTEVIVKRGIVKQSGALTLVHKHPADCVEGVEISFYDLSTRDQGELTQAIYSGGEGLPSDFLSAVAQGIKHRDDTGA